MPEFILDHGTADASRTFCSLDDFTRAYIEAMFWTDTGSDHADEGLDHVSFAQLAPEALEEIKEECANFLKIAVAQIAKAINVNQKYSEARAGHDFWLTRNHHGAGFWDRGLGDVGEDLTALADHEGMRCIYCGNDGLIYYTMG